MITGSDDAGEAVRAIEAGASDYICKPIHPDALVASVRRAVEVKRLEWSLVEHSRNLEELVSLRTKQLERALQLAKKTAEGSCVRTDPPPEVINGSAEVRRDLSLANHTIHRHSIWFDNPEDK